MHIQWCSKISAFFCKGHNSANIMAFRALLLLWDANVQNRKKDTEGRNQTILLEAFFTQRLQCWLVRQSYMPFRNFQLKNVCTLNRPHVTTFLKQLHRGKRNYELHVKPNVCDGLKSIMFQWAPPLQLNWSSFRTKTQVCQNHTWDKH